MKMINVVKTHVTIMSVFCIFGITAMDTEKNILTRWLLHRKERFEIPQKRFYLNEVDKQVKESKDIITQSLDSLLKNENVEYNTLQIKENIELFVRYLSQYDPDTDGRTASVMKKHTDALELKKSIDTQQADAFKKIVDIFFNDLSRQLNKKYKQLLQDSHTKKIQFTHVPRANIKEDFRLLEQTECNNQTKIAVLQILFWSSCYSKNDIIQKSASHTTTNLSQKKSCDRGNDELNKAAAPRVRLQISIGQELQRLGSSYPAIVSKSGQLEWPNIIIPEVDSNTPVWINDLISEFLRVKGSVELVNPLFEIEALNESIKDHRDLLIKLLETDADNKKKIDKKSSFIKENETYLMSVIETYVLKLASIKVDNQEFIKDKECVLQELQLIKQTIVDNQNI